MFRFLGSVAQGIIMMKHNMTLDGNKKTFLIVYSFLLNTPIREALAFQPT